MKKLILIFLFLPLMCVFAQKQTIEQAEFFTGDDPGEGKGTPLNLSQLGDPKILDLDGTRSDMGYYGGPDAPLLPYFTIP